MSRFCPKNNEDKFLNEMALAVLLVRLNPFKDEIIPLHPDSPAQKYNYLHEKKDIQLNPQAFQCGERIKLSQIQTNDRPTTLSKWAVEEEMRKRLFH